MAFEAASTEVDRTPAASCVVHAWLTSAVYQQLQNMAADLGTHPDRLSAEILAAVLQNPVKFTVLAGHVAQR